MNYKRHRLNVASWCGKCSENQDVRGLKGRSVGGGLYTFHTLRHFVILLPLLSAVQAKLTAADTYEVDDTPAQATIFTVGSSEQHNFHSETDEDWVKFYAPTDWVYEVDATQLGTNSDLQLELYYEQPDGSLALIDSADKHLSGSNVTESLTLDLKNGNSGELPGVYYLRVSSADPALFGPGSEYKLQIFVPAGPDGGLPYTPLADGGPLFAMGVFSVYMDPPRALSAGAAWRVTELTNQTYYSNAALYGLPIGDTPYHLAFQAVPGFQAPTNTVLLLSTNQTNNIQIYYTYTNLSPLAVTASGGADGVFRITYLANASNRYAIEESTNLFDWKPLVTNQIPPDGLLRLSITNPLAKPRCFYRTHWIP